MAALKNKAYAPFLLCALLRVAVCSRVGSRASTHSCYRWCSESYGCCTQSGSRRIVRFDDITKTVGPVPSFRFMSLNSVFLNNMRKGFDIIESWNRWWKYDLNYNKHPRIGFKANQRKGGVGGKGGGLSNGGGGGMVKCSGELKIWPAMISSTPVAGALVLKLRVL